MLLHVRLRASGREADAGGAAPPPACRLHLRVSPRPLFSPRPCSPPRTSFSWNSSDGLIPYGQFSSSYAGAASAFLRLQRQAGAMAARAALVGCVPP